MTMYNCVNKNYSNIKEQSVKICSICLKYIAVFITGICTHLIGHYLTLGKPEGVIKLN